MAYEDEEPMTKMVKSLRQATCYYAADVLAGAMDAGVIDEDTARAILTAGIPATHAGFATVNLHPFVDTILAASERPVD